MKRPRTGRGVVENNSEESGGTTSPLLVRILLSLVQETRDHLRFHEQFPEAPPRGNTDGVSAVTSAGELGVDTCHVYGIDCEAVVTSDRPRALYTERPST